MSRNSTQKGLPNRLLALIGVAILFAAIYIAMQYSDFTIGLGLAICATLGLLAVVHSLRLSAHAHRMQLLADEHDFEVMLATDSWTKRTAAIKNTESTLVNATFHNSATGPATATLLGNKCGDAMAGANGRLSNMDHLLNVRNIER